MPLANFPSQPLSPQYQGGSSGLSLFRIFVITVIILGFIITGIVVIIKIKTRSVPDLTKEKPTVVEFTPKGQRIPNSIKSYVGKITVLSPESQQFLLSSLADYNYLSEDKVFAVMVHQETQVMSETEAKSPFPASSAKSGRQESSQKVAAAFNQLKIGETVVVISKANIKDKNTFFVDRVITSVNDETTTTQGVYAEDVTWPYTTFGGQVVLDLNNTGETAVVPKEIPKEVLGYLGEIVSILPAGRQFSVFASKRRNYLLEDAYFLITVKESALINEYTPDDSEFNYINFDDLKLGDMVMAVSSSNIKDLDSFAVDRVTRIVEE